MPLHYDKVFLDDARLVALFNEDGTMPDLARREGVTTKSLRRAWQVLQRTGQLPHTRPHSPTSHGRYLDEHESDGRPSVDDDPLLTRLRKFHTIVDAPQPPGAPDDGGSSD
jgi:transposase-like protein